MNTKIVGDYGEEIAKNYLIEKGYKILEQNFVACGCEVDIICETVQKAMSAVCCNNPKKISRIKSIFLSKNSLEKTKRDLLKNESETVIVFVEVKTRANTQFGRPLEAVTRVKQLRYIKAAKSYLVRNRLSNIDVRFDVIEVLDSQVNHIISAYEC
ncbi:MAG: YraN family protein [Clostridia bacterium]|nr:YraN family protein [Clostridia bacterium]